MGKRGGGALFRPEVLSSTSFARLESELVNAFRSAAQAATGPTMYVLNADPSLVDGGAMAYPILGTYAEGLHRPDVHQLARLAELAGVDLRILVTIRAAAALEMPHEQFQNAMQHGHVAYAVELIDEAFVLAGQLALIDPAFTHCADIFSPTGVMKRGAKNTYPKLGHFLFPTLVDPAGEPWATMLHSTQGTPRSESSPAVHHFRDANFTEEILKHLGAAMSLIQSRCGVCIDSAEPPEPMNAP